MKTGSLSLPLVMFKVTLCVGVFRHPAASCSIVSWGVSSWQSSSLTVTSIYPTVTLVASTGKSRYSHLKHYETCELYWLLCDVKMCLCCTPLQLSARCIQRFVCDHRGWDNWHFSLPEALSCELRESVLRYDDMSFSLSSSLTTYPTLPFNLRPPFLSKISLSVF